MAAEILTFDKEYDGIEIISRSKFLHFGIPVVSATEAVGRVAQIRKLHPFATHVCYAYIVSERGVTEQRFSDDGEPKGTAGQPILDCLLKKGLSGCLVVVVRYFGGVKLGAGGLVRAYSGGAALACIGAGTAILKESRTASIDLDYSSAAEIRLEFLEERRSYGDFVSIVYLVEIARTAEFEAAVTRETRGQTVVTWGKEVKYLRSQVTIV